MSGDDQSAMKRDINAQLIKMRREQRARLERQALRHVLAVWLLLLALLVALGFALWWQQRLRDDQDSKLNDDSTPGGAAHVAAPLSWRCSVGRAASARAYAWTPGWWAEVYTLLQGGSTPPRATTVYGHEQWRANEGSIT